MIKNKGKSDERTERFWMIVCCLMVAVFTLIMCKQVDNALISMGY